MDVGVGVSVVVFVGVSVTVGVLVFVGVSVTVGVCVLVGVGVGDGHVPHIGFGNTHCGVLVSNNSGLDEIKGTHQELKS